MQIKIGVPVMAEDGAAGKVERIILHPATQELEGIVVVESGMLPQDVVVPVDRILSADENGVRVKGTVEEIANLEPYTLSQYTEPPEDWIPPTDDPSSIYLFPQSPIAVGAFTRASPSPPPPEHEMEALEPGDIDIGGSTVVYCRDKEVGHVDHVYTAGDSDHVTHLVMHYGPLRRDVVIPVQYVSEITDEGIYLSLTEEELERLPPMEVTA